MSNLGDNLKKEREKNNFTQEHLAKLIGVKPNTIWRWESGDRVPRIGMLNTLASLFGTTVSYLTRDTTDDMTLTEQKSPSVITQPPVQHAAPIPHDELPPNVKKIRGKTYMEGVALDTLAHQLRDRLIIELFENDEKTREEIKDTLHDCLRLYADHEVSHKTA